MSVFDGSEQRMTAEEFMAWYDRQPEGMRYELLDGQIYPNEMQGERLRHAEAKARVLEQFRAEIRARHLPCQGLGDGMPVRINADTTFEPDALVRCGPDLPGDTTSLSDVVIVAEVVSPSSRRLDALTKLMSYFKSPAITHYLIVFVQEKQAVHHRRAKGEKIDTSIHHSGMIVFDPPGLSLDLDELFRGL